MNFSLSKQCLDKSMFARIFPLIKQLVRKENIKYNPGKDKLSSKIFTGKAVPREDRLELQDKAYIISSQGM